MKPHGLAHPVLAVVALLALLAAACAPAPAPASPAAPAAQPPPAPREEPRYGGTLTVSLAGEPEHFDLHQSIAAMVLESVAPAYNGLVQFDPLDVTKVVPDLVERWEVSPDGATYTFSLRKGVKFHNGAALGADDVVATINRLVNPPKGVVSILKPELQPIASVEAPDASTVVIKTKKPFAGLLRHLASGSAVIYPKALLEAKGDMKKDIVGTGPFKLKSHTIGATIELARNPDYFVKGRPYLDGLLFYVIPDRGTRFAALQTGQVKKTGYIFSQLSASEIDILKKANSPVRVVEAWGVFGPRFDFNTTKPPFDNNKVRRAVFLAVDRQAAVKVLGEGLGVPGHYFPPKEGIKGMPWEDLLKVPGFRQPKDQDIAEAKKLMAEAGYPNGFKAALMVRNLTDIREKNAPFFKDQLSKLGIDVTFEVIDDAALWPRVNKKEYDIAAIAISWPLPDYDAYLRLFHTQGAWSFLSGNPELDRLLEQQQGTQDAAARYKTMLEIEQKLIQFVPRIVTNLVPDMVGVWPEVKNWVPQVEYAANKMDHVWLSK